MLSELDFYPFQPDVIRELKTRDVCGLFIDMGLGKTVMVLTAFADSISDIDGPASAAGRAMLVIAPKRVVETVWENESKSWAHLRHLRFVLITGAQKHRQTQLRRHGDVYLMNVDNVPWLATELYTMQRTGYRLPFNRLAVDESSMFKSPSTKRFKAIRAILPAFQYRNVLTGTPTPNGLHELWPQMFILDQGETLGQRYETFMGRYFETDDEGMTVPKTGSFESVFRAVSDKVIRIDNRQVSGIPPLVHKTVNFTLPPAARRVYELMERQMFVELERVLAQFAGRPTAITATNAAVLIGKCHQIANGAIFDNDARDTWHEIHTARIDTLLETLEDVKTPVLIAYSYRHDRERLLGVFGKDTPYIGGGNKYTNDIIEEWNAGNVQRLLIHPRSGGHGLNLQKGPGHTLVYFSNTWSRELYDQLNARLARGGQASPYVNVARLVATDTIDEVMRDRLDRRGEAQQRGLDLLKEYQERKTKHG